MTSPRLTTDQKQAIPVDLLEAARAIADTCVPGMCLTWDHSFGLQSAEQQEPLRRNMAQVAYHDVATAIACAILAERQKHDRPAFPDLQAEAERVFADVQREVLVEDAKAVIAKALDAATEAERERCGKIAADFYFVSNTRDPDQLIQEAAANDRSFDIETAILERY